MATPTMSLLADYTSDFAFFPESASTMSGDSDWIFYFITIVCVIFFIPMMAALFWFAWNYKKAKGEQAESQIDHNTAIELVWSIGPSFLLVVMFYFGASNYLTHRSIPEGAYEIGCEAYKWGWTMNYGNGVYHPELHIVKDEPTKLTMTSKDVIHSLYIPAFRVKKDIVPGRFNYMWFKATKASERVPMEEVEKLLKKDKETGASWDYERQFTPDGYKFYDLYCAEYCGTNHSQMQTVVVVHETQEDLNAWIKKYSAWDPEKEKPAEYGAKLYERRGCKGCHSLDGSKMTGPSYKDAYGSKRKLKDKSVVDFDENYVQESILYPKAKVAAGYQPVMPSYKGQLSDEDVYTLIEFIKAQSSSSSAPAKKESGSEDAGSKDAETDEGSKEAAETE